ncbi:MAG: DinB family protein [Phycisphaerales bacterium]
MPQSPHAAVSRHAPIIEQFGQGADVPRQAIAGLSTEHLLAVPVPGKWSIQELVVHLYQSDLVAVDRMWRIAAMERPLMMGYDENAFMRALHPEAVDAHLAAEAFALNRRLMVAVLRSLPEAAFSRAGIHSERGVLTLEQVVEGHVRHLDHHMGFLREKLRVLGRVAPGDPR